MTTPAYYRVNPKTKASLLTIWKGEADKAGSSYGFTIDHGTPFRVARSAGSGLQAVHRMYNAKRGDFIWSPTSGDVATLKKDGYVDQGVAFYAASAGSTGCNAKAERFHLGSQHQITTSKNTPTVMNRYGWRTDGVSFYAAGSSSGSTPVGSAPAVPTSFTTPPLTSTGASNSDGVFSIAVLPDTQQEVLSSSDDRFAARNKWLVANRKQLDLRYEAQVGDLVNWDTSGHDQYKVASSAMKVSEAAGMPWSASIGNHDAAATCPGGAACPGTDVRSTIRDTRTFNSYFPLNRFRAIKGVYEKNKIDNSYFTFSAEGKSWMVMNLELWPRSGVINWANAVVKANPKSNVILVTHSYLDKNGAISTSSGYGANSPKTMYNNLVAKNTNIKLIVSGHVGTAASRSDARSGNPVVSYLQCFHDTKSNPTRLITINTKKGSIRGQVYYPKDKRYLASADKTYSGMKWVG